MKATRHQALLVASMVLAAATAAGLVACRWGAPDWVELLGFAVAAFLLGSRTIRLSRMLGTCSVGFIFVFAAVVHLGPTAGVVAAIFAAIGGTFVATGPGPLLRKPPAIVVLAAIANLTLAAAVAGAMHQALNAAYAELGISAGVLPIFLAIAAYYAVNSFGVALLGSTTTGQSPARLWAGSIAWTSVPYMVGGAAVAVVHFLALATSPLIWFALIPAAIIAHVAIDMRARAQVGQPATETSAAG